MGTQENLVGWIVDSGETNQNMLGYQLDEQLVEV